MLSVNNIYKSFNRLNILNDVNFSQKKGETIGLMGKNGSGKSTLLRIISRIMKADSGSIVFNGHDLLSSNSAHRKNMFYIGHEPGMYSFFSPFENLKFLLKTRGLSSKIKNINEKLDYYGLKEFNDTPISVFSKGMLQKLKLVQIDLINPDLLLFDEPYTSLDGDGIVLVDKLIEGIKKQNKSLILVLHDEIKAKKYADYILTLELGKVMKKSAN